MIAPGQDQELRTLGFMNEDLIYGLLQSGDILTDENGHSTEGLTSFRIEDFEGNLKKEYHQEGMYIVNPFCGRDSDGVSACCKRKTGIILSRKRTIS